MIPVRVRSEWARLQHEGRASVWAPASQESSHVGHASVGVVSMRGAFVSLPLLSLSASLIVVMHCASGILSVYAFSGDGH